MAFIKYLTLYPGKEDAESWLKSYKSAKLEKWCASQILDCVGLNLKKAKG